MSNKKETMQFAVIAYDGNDKDALARRMVVREAHLKVGKEMHDAGKWLYAAGILNDEGKMCGSMIVCEFESKAEMEKQWLSREPYIAGKVWQKIDIRRVQVAPFCAPK
ncbi:MAG: YciI family protein [Candidatus Aminicenantes bacterium]|nr:YciI family protein [Candidatus Aminicenantes bacterium]